MELVRVLSKSRQVFDFKLPQNCKFLSSDNKLCSNWFFLLLEFSKIWNLQVFAQCEVSKCPKFQFWTLNSTLHHSVVKKAKKITPKSTIRLDKYPSKCRPPFFWPSGVGRQYTVWKFSFFSATPDFTWNQFWLISNGQKLPFWQFWTLWILIFEKYILENVKNSQKSKFRAAKMVKIPLF